MTNKWTVFTSGDFEDTATDPVELVRIAREQARYSDQDRIMLVDIKCVTCGRVYENALGDTVNKLVGRQMQAFTCLICDDEGGRLS